MMSELLSVDMVFVAFTFLFVNLFNVVGVLIGLTNQAEVPQDKQLGVQSSWYESIGIRHYHR